MLRKAPKGELATIPNGDVNAWAGYDPDHEFAAHFVAKFCDENRKVLSWMAYNGRMIAKSKRDVSRIRKYRKERNLERKKGGANVTRNVPRTFRKRSASPNPTQPNPLGVGVGGRVADGAYAPEGAAPPPEVQELITAVATAAEMQAIREEAGLPPLRIAK
jgi:hypothetical protein